MVTVNFTVKQAVANAVIAVMNRDNDMLLACLPVVESVGCSETWYIEKGDYKKNHSFFELHLTLTTLSWEVNRVVKWKDIKHMGKTVKEARERGIYALESVVKLYESLTDIERLELSALL